MILFEWDDEKAKSNERKHGIKFTYATKVFSDPYAIFEQDRVEDGEARWQAIGLVAGIELLVVAHTIREADGDELIRIISARLANRKERNRYGENH
jgi:uncharacterized protein